MRATIEKFIRENGLTFDGVGSDLNSNCCILAGFADFKEISSGTVLCNIVKKVYPSTTGYNKELKRVFNFAYENNYGSFWETRDAKKSYKF